jgi:hypothetical protein
LPFSVQHPATVRHQVLVDDPSVKETTMTMTMTAAERSELARLLAGEGYTLMTAPLELILAIRPGAARLRARP